MLHESRSSRLEAVNGEVAAEGRPGSKQTESWDYTNENGKKKQQ